MHLGESSLYFCTQINRVLLKIVRECIEYSNSEKKSLKVVKEDESSAESLWMQLGFFAFILLLNWWPFRCSWSALVIFFYAQRLTGLWDVAMSVLAAAAFHVYILMLNRAPRRAFQFHFPRASFCFPAAGTAVLQRIGLNRVSVKVEKGNITLC